MHGIQVRSRCDDGDWSEWKWLRPELSAQTPGNYIHLEFRWWSVYMPSFSKGEDD